MDFAPEFEDETGINENYDPDSDKESGYLSTAWWRKYADFLERKLKSAENSTLKDEEIKPCQRINDCANVRVTGGCLGPKCGVYLSV